MYEASVDWSTRDLAYLNNLFAARRPEALLGWVAQQFGSSAVLTCSFGGAAGMVLLDMVSRIGGSVPVLFLDTDLLFPETYALAEQAAEKYGVHIERRRPALTLAAQERLEGPELYSRDPDRCCGMRKVAPLTEALKPYDAWLSGIRRDQTGARAAVPLLAWNARHNLLKISPLALWTEREVWAYIHKHGVPYNPLLDQGYTSIGCAPCTRPASAAREGRWAGFAKSECGIHL